MFSYKIIKSPSFSISTKVIDNIFKVILDNIKGSQNGVLNIVFVSPDEIQALNNQYRKKDSATDVLSFHYFDEFSDISDDEIA